LVWRTLVGRARRAVATSAWHHPAYRHAFAQAARWAEWVPSLDEINEWIEPTGWQAKFVEGYVPVDLYSRLQVQHIFPLSWRMRRLRDVEHSPAPDLFHDLFGHVMMLFDPDYSGLVYEWAQRSSAAPPTRADRDVEQALADLTAAKCEEVVDDDDVAECAERLVATHKVAVAECSRHFQHETFYTWAIEFGLMQDNGEPITLTGAAGLSSLGEMARIFSGEVSFRPFNRQSLRRPVDYTEYQSVMFVSPSWTQYLDTLRSI
jgi:phenylalanine-4-hydroxylase